MKKNVLVFSVILALLFAINGCASPTATSTQPAATAVSTNAVTATAPSATEVTATKASATEASTTVPAVITSDDNKTYKYAIIYSIAVDFFDEVTRGAKDEVAKSGKNIELIINAPDKGDVNQQIEIMENMINMHVDGIAIGPSDSDALTPYINKAVEAGIPVVTFDTEAPNSKSLGYIGTDNYKAGKLLGQSVADLNPNANVIITISVPTQLGLQQRVKGAKDVWASYPNIKVLDMRSSGGDPAVTLSNIEDMVKTYPDFDVLVGIDAQGGPAAVSAWKALGFTDSSKNAIVFDDLPANIQGIRDGQINTAISQFEYQWGVEIVNKLWDATHGGTVPKFTEINAVAVTKDNVDQYFPAK